MIRNTQLFWPALSAVLLGATLAGCGGSAPAENTGGTASTGTASTGTASTGTASTGTTSTTTTNTKADDDHAHAPGEAAHSHGGEAGQGAAPSELASFFPGAQLKKKAFPLSADDAAHMSGESGVKFSGKEKEWEVYEASQNGARVGYAVMTHADLPGGGDMHAMFAVDKKFKITKTDVSDAPNEAKMKQFVSQAAGKTLSANWKVGQGLKPVSGVAPADAQIAADAVKKGLVILDNNFNAAHGAHSASPAAGGTSHEDAPGHKDDGHAH